MPLAHVSVDLDPVDTHLAGYGLDAPPCDRIYRTSIPRILDLLDRVGIKATFFVVARDAEREALLWRDVVGRGHEIGSHSVTHPVPFSPLPRARIADELQQSRASLEQVIGRPVIGFRAPNWDVNSETLAAVAEAGYRYDASILPTPALFPGAVLRFVLSAGRKRDLAFGHTLRTAFSPRLPYRIASNGGLWEFPIAVSPVLRVPFTHTLWYLAPQAVCRRAFDAIRRSTGPLCYMFHAADLLDLHADGIDPRMGRHPGMQLPLTEKTKRLETILRAVAGDYRVVTYAEALASGYYEN